jgi:hypothetical protein
LPLLLRRTVLSGCLLLLWPSVLRPWLLLICSPTLQSRLRPLLLLMLSLGLLLFASC